MVLNSLDIEGLNYGIFLELIVADFDTHFNKKINNKSEVTLMP